MAFSRIPRVGWALAGAALMFGVTGAITYASAATEPSSQGAVYHPIDPVRIMNTRPGTVNVGTDPKPFGKDETRTLQVAGKNGIPADATAVVINFTVDKTTDWSFLTVWPSKQLPRPDVSNINWTGKDQTIANSATIKLGPNGALDVYNAFGSVDVIADIAGYYTEGNFVTVPTTEAPTTSSTAPTTSSTEAPTTSSTSSSSTIALAG
jgi:hypothetical protein